MALWYIYEATYLSIIQLLKKDNKKNYNSKNISFALLKITTNKNMTQTASLSLVKQLISH